MAFGGQICAVLGFSAMIELLVRLWLGRSGEGSISLPPALNAGINRACQSIPAKSRRGRPRVDFEEVSARLERRMLDALDAWIAAQPEPRPTRSEAIRRLVAEALGMPAAVKSPRCPPRRTRSFELWKCQRRRLRRASHADGDRRRGAGGFH